MDLPKQGISRTFRDKFHKELKEITRIGISYTCNALSKQIPLKVNEFAETRKSQHLWVVCRHFQGIWAKPRPPRKANQSFPAKTDISIPLSNWSRDLVAPTHKYCGKLEFRSYAL